MKFNFIISTIKNSNKYFYFIVIILLSISCNKTDSYENLNLLIENEWNLFSREKNNINIIENCDLDDKLLFKNRSTFTYEFGVLNCFENENKKTGLKWKIVDNHTTLREMIILGLLRLQCSTGTSPNWISTSSSTTINCNYEI